MDIKIGQNYINKTWRFMLPCLRGHGTTFILKYNSVFKLAVGIHDTLVDGSYISEGRNIYILLDKLYRPKEFENFLDYVRYQDYYVADYCPDSEMINSRKHMLVIKIPEIYNNAYDNFLKGRYSKMFDDRDDIKLLFGQPQRKQEYNILTQHSDRIGEFVKELNDYFGTNITAIDIESNPESEYELPLIKKEEVFNCSDSQRVFFCAELDKNWINEEQSLL